MGAKQKLSEQTNKPQQTNNKRPNLDLFKEAGLSDLSTEKCEELLALHCKELAAEDLVSKDAQSCKKGHLME